jgi:hypothetical protein
MSEKVVFSCLICGKEYSNLAFAEDHVETEHQEILGDGIAEHFIQTSFVDDEEQLSGKAIEEAQDEKPDETEVITEDELMLKVITDNWSELTPQEKAAVIERSFAKERGSDKGLVDKSKRKLFSKASGRLEDTISPELAETLREQIIDQTESGICPLCAEHWTQDQFYEGASFPEDLSILKKKAYESTNDNANSRIKLVIHHVASKHMDLYKLLYPIFNQFRWVMDVPSAHLQPQSSPQSLSEGDIESLSAEELHEKAKDASFRKGIFLRWKQMKETENRKR